MPKLTINGMEITVEPGASILQAAEQLGIEIPRFCYHDRLSVPANCRMCLVQVEGAPKPVASCAMPCAENMKVLTDSDMAKKARRGVMEFLLINHPLDCPICDQGGECDLQDQAMAYGFDRSRYNEEKRAVKDKELGPLVKTVMTRCIHCTRCVRFGQEIAGVDELGVLNRGEALEIGTFVEQMVTSELSGNIIDICPVGALTSKPYAFHARPWELKRTETIDVLDAVGCNIRVDSRGDEVMRILPSLHEDVNEEWISDKTRFSYDGLKVRRLDKPFIRENGALRPASWEEAFDVIAKRLKRADAGKVAALAGSLCDLESMAALKDLMTALGSPHIDCREEGANFDTGASCGYLYNPGIARTEEADAILLVGTNPRHEAAMLNARIRKAWMERRAKIAVIGPAGISLNYPHEHIGTGPDALEKILSGKSAFAETLRKAQKPLLALGAGALRRPDGAAIHALAREIAEKFQLVREGWNGFGMVHAEASRAGGLELGFLPGKDGLDTAGIIDAVSRGQMNTLFLLGADDLPFDRFGRRVFIVYQGHHGDRGAHHADVILPGAAYTEKHGLYMNMEGRVQAAKPAVMPPGDAREDWKILRALSEILGHKLPYDSLSQLRQRLAEANPRLGRLDVLEPAVWQAFGTKGKVSEAPFVLPVENFYQTDVISRASRTMAECAAAFAEKAGGCQAQRTGTDG